MKLLIWRKNRSFFVVVPTSGLFPEQTLVRIVIRSFGNADRESLAPLFWVPSQHFAAVLRNNCNIGD